MKSFVSLRYTLALLPAFALGISVASADKPEQDRPCDDARASTHAEQHHGKQKGEPDRKVSDRAGMQAGQNHGQHSAEKKSRASERASSAAKANAAPEAAVHGSHYLESKPIGNYFSGNIVGHDVMNRRDNKVVGTVNDLLIDRDGQIGAVIISTGGILGLGGKDLAIAWDQIERKIDGEDITLSIDLPDASLVDAPEFARN